MGSPDDFSRSEYFSEGLFFAPACSCRGQRQFSPVARAARGQTHRTQNETAQNKPAGEKSHERTQGGVHMLAERFESAVGRIIQSVSSASTELEAAAGTLTTTAETTQRLSGSGDVLRTKSLGFATPSAPPDRRNGANRTSDRTAAISSGRSSRLRQANVRPCFRNGTVR